MDDLLTWCDADVSISPTRLEHAVTDSLQHKILLSEDEMPTRWYNVLHDVPTPPPPVLHPGTGQPVGLTPLMS